jgi:hypothetical protein
VAKPKDDEKDDKGKKPFGGKQKPPFQKGGKKPPSKGK